MDFLIKRDDLHKTRFAEEDEAPTLSDGEALLQVERFGLTANNITYGVFGDAMNYWDFFPADDGWGHLPVWGFGSVADPGETELAAGTRVYGYFPLASRLKVVPGRVNARGFIDAAPHREPLPSAYQAYRANDTDPAYESEREDEQILFWPLFYTSFLIDDFFADEKFFGAETIVLSSASSKTAIIAAYLLAQREGIELVGLTSGGNKDFVEELGIYDSVVAYDEIDSLPGDRAVYADFAGDGETRKAVHEHYGDRLAHSAMIGMTHHEAIADGAGELTPKPRFFFAPNRIKKRGEDWGTAELEQKVADAWHPFAEWASEWLQVERISTPEEIERVYKELLEGRIDPKAGHVVELGD